MDEILVGEYNPIHVPKIIFGPGTAMTRVPEVIKSLHKKRSLIVTTNPIVANTNMVQQLKQALDDLNVGVFSNTEQHVPRSSVYEGARMAREVDVDMVISFGGGSCLDCARGIQMVLAEGERLDDLSINAQHSRKNETPPFTKKTFIPHIAIPTTLAGAEFSCVAGITNTKTKTKEIFINPQLTPSVIIHDPEVTLPTPMPLWISTGAKTVADAIDAVCSPKPQPMDDLLALTSLHLFATYLPITKAEPKNIYARSQLFQATLMATLGANNTRVSIVGSIRHQLGAMLNIPHGIASTVILPYVMEFNRMATAERLALIAQAMGSDTKTMTPEEAAHVAVKAVRNLIIKLGLPEKLRDVGVNKIDLEAIASRVMGELTAIAVNPPVSDRSQIFEILNNAW